MLQIRWRVGATALVARDTSTTLGGVGLQKEGSRIESDESDIVLPFIGSATLLSGVMALACGERREWRFQPFERFSFSLTRQEEGIIVGSPMITFRTSSEELVRAAWSGHQRLFYPTDPDCDPNRAFDPPLQERFRVEIGAIEDAYRSRFQIALDGGALG